VGVRVLVTGSSGLIGSTLVPRLEREGHAVEKLARGPAWDPEAGHLDPAVVKGFDAVVHLAGAGIGDHRWTPAHKQRVLDSRVNGTGALARELASGGDTPRILVSSSAVGYYGSRGDDTLIESSAPGDDFLAQVCVGWEGATQPAEDAGVRVVHLRTGLVLSPRGGALRATLPIFKLGLGGRLGTGRQYWSWIAIDDEVEVILHALANDDVVGPVNATAPEPVTNAEFTRTLGRVLRRPAVMVVPRAALALRFGREMADVMLLSGQRVVPAKLELTGFRFAQPELETALRSML
jgi:uncharacterized protein (TIGR01777 family)